MQANNLSESQLSYVPQLKSYRLSANIDQFSATPGADLAPNLRYSVAAVPNDPIYPSQYALPKISAPTGWDTTTGSSSIVVADLDTGFAVNHQDLASKWAPGGYDFVDNTSDVSAGKTNPAGGGVSHGTMTASIIAAATNNSLGVAGVCWQCRLLPIQVLDDTGSGDTSTVASGIYYATDQGARVINMSLGSTFSDSIMQAAVNYALAHNVVVVAAAGNSGPSGGVLYPGAYPGVLAVGATDSSDVIASFSSRGPQVGVVAPGVGITGAAWSSGNQTSAYATGSGTSFASPEAAGTAGLILSVQAGLSQTGVVHLLENTTDKPAGMSGQNFTNSYGYGRINVSSALSGGAISGLGSYGWQFVSQTAYSDSGRTTPVTITNLSPGQTVYLRLVAKNTGTATWLNSGANPIDLGTTFPQDRSSTFCSSGWLACNRPARLTEASVAPGASGTFDFTYTAPSAGGLYLEHFSLVAEGLAWLNDPGVNYYTVVNSAYAWQFIAQAAYTDSSKTTPVDLTQLTGGQTVYLTLTVKNAGTATWYQNGSFPLDLGADQPQDRSSAFCAAGWLSCNRPTQLPQASVAPDQTVTFGFNYTAPVTAGLYLEHFDLVAEGLSWLPDLGINYYTIVHSP